MNIRKQAKMLYVWYLKKQRDWDTIHKENEVTETSEDLVSVKKQLAMRTEHLRAYEIVL